MGKTIKYTPIALIAAVVLMIAVKLVYNHFIAEPLVTQPPIPVNVAVEVIRPQVYDDVMELPGRLTAETSAVISSELSGRLEEWKITEGEQVEKGQVLVVLNQDSLNARQDELIAQKDRVVASKELAESSVKVAEITLKTADNDVATAENRLTTANAEEALAEDELDRLKSLFKKDVVSQIELDRSQTEFVRKKMAARSAENALKQARQVRKNRELELKQANISVIQAEAGLKEVAAGLASVQVALEKGRIKAPFAGVFDEFLREAGEVVQPGDPLGQLFDYSSIRIRVDVPDRFAPFLSKSQPMLAAYIEKNFPGAVQNIQGVLVIPGLPTLNGGRSEGIELPASIVRLGKAADPTSNTFAVELRASNPGAIFKQGLLARARITVLSYKGAILVPLSAIRVTENGPRCMVAVKDGDGYKAESRTVEPRSIRGESVLVRGEIKAGDRLIVTGVQELLDGQQVAVIRTNDQAGKPESANE